ncbi:MAG: hypothetical protein OES47_04410, partial [Acidobacteriota bacterium]|nr:hypothetical protein [Acidobacteriota bacterium]
TRHLARAGRIAMIGVVVASGLHPRPARAQTTPAIDEIRREILELRSDYEARLAALEARLSRLAAETDSVSDSASDPVSDPVSDPIEPDLEALRAAARAAATETPSPPPSDPTGESSVSRAETAVPSVGRERNLNRLNPEVSFTGIVVGNSSDADREEFEVHEFELDLQSILDPFSRTRFTLAFREGEVEIEEGWINYASLPGGLDLLAGRFRQRFGPLNRQHLHALPQSTYPLPYQLFFGDEGLAQTGLSMTWLLPKPWATANEVTLEITNGENEEAFSGDFFEDFALLGRLVNFWQLSDAAFFEWGVSGISGETSSGGDSRVLGTDFTLNWQPPGRAKYRELTWRGELLVSNRDTPVGKREATGFYSYVEGLLKRGLYAGLRYDRVEDPLSPADVTWSIIPYLTWWQSEYVRLRGEYGLLKDDSTGEKENRFTFQVTWAAGPHKHEAY